MQFPEVIWIQNNDNKGFSKANNQGIRVCRGKYVLLLNPDTLLEEATLDQCIRFMEDKPEAGALGVRMYDGSGEYLPESKRGLPTPLVSFFKMSGISRIFSRSGFFNRYHLGNLEETGVYRIEVLSGAFMFIRAEVFQRVGLLDEAFFMYGEDIDLSYRIHSAGYDIWYLGTTSIVHFKGESTRKATFRYYRVFYNAMRIFADKHFARSRSNLYSFALSAAIGLRGLFGFLSGTVKKWFRPVLAVVALIFIFIGVKWLWGSLYYNDPNYFPDSYLWVNVPLYAIAHIAGLLIAAYFHRPGRSIELLKGIIIGLLVSLIVYALLPEQFRSSRILPLLGSAGSFIFLFGVDQLFYSRKTSGFNRRVLLVGSRNSVDDAKKLLNQGGTSHNFIGFISNQDTDAPDWLGKWENIDDVLRAYGITDLIFCDNEQNLHEELKLLRSYGRQISFRWFSTEAVAVIGSSSKKARGEIYTREIEYRITDPYLMDMKVLIDIVFALFYLICAPIIWVFGKNARHGLKHAIPVLLRKNTWVGYLDGDPFLIELPKIKRGVFPNASIDNSMDPDKVHRLNFLYAVEYSPWDDLATLMQRTFANN
jgi:GT2 family glycosyltransferase